MADLRDKRDKLLKQLDKLVEDFERERVIHEEAAAKATALKLEVDEVQKQCETARAQVYLPSPTHTPFPALPSEQGDDDDFGCDHGCGMDDLGHEYR